MPLCLTKPATPSCPFISAESHFLSAPEIVQKTQNYPPNSEPTPASNPPKQTCPGSCFTSRKVHGRTLHSDLVSQLRYSVCYSLLSKSQDVKIKSMQKHVPETKNSLNWKSPGMWESDEAFGLLQSRVLVLASSSSGILIYN